MPKLIIVRGPSGSGKSTVVAQLMKQATRLTAHIDQDMYRFLFTDKDKTGDVRREMITSDVLIALKHGCDVILSGILSGKTYTYGPMFEKLLTAHPQENYIFYLDVSLEETVRRHKGRPEADKFTAAEMAEWYTWTAPLSHAGEMKIPEDSTLEETVKFIQERAGI